MTPCGAGAVHAGAYGDDVDAGGGEDDALHGEDDVGVGGAHVPSYLAPIQRQQHCHPCRYVAVAVAAAVVVSGGDAPEHVVAVAAWLPLKFRLLLAVVVVPVVVAGGVVGGAVVVAVLVFVAAVVGSRSRYLGAATNRR